jgi:hypothetical protein
MRIDADLSIAPTPASLTQATVLCCLIISRVSLMNPHILMRLKFRITVRYTDTDKPITLYSDFIYGHLSGDRLPERVSPYACER